MSLPSPDKLFVYHDAVDLRKSYLGLCKILEQDTEEQILLKRRTISLPVIDELFIYLHKLNSWDYLNDVLVRIDSHPIREVHLLTPKFWKNNITK